MTADTAGPAGRRPAILDYLGPNWFASVMGTGIVATAGASLPVHLPGLRAFAQVVWVIAATWLVVLIVATVAHWVRNSEMARSHARNPQMAHFYGAAPMALLTVGSGALLVGVPPPAGGWERLSGSEPGRGGVRLPELAPGRGWGSAPGR